MIFYFSGTGNTEWAAREMSAALGEELRPIPRLDPEKEVFTLRPDETIGFCFPVHAWRPPAIVREFIRKCRFSQPEGHFCWILCTAGDDIGETIDIAQRDLATTGLHADCVFSLIMPESYVGLPGMDVDTAEVAEKKKARAAERIEGYIRHVKQRDKGYSALDLSRWPRINSRLLGSLFNRFLVKDSPFVVDKERCKKCGKCVSACPVDNIILDGERHPQWLHNNRCTTCFACYHHCPAHAIEWGKMTRHKGQYYMIQLPQVESS